MSRNDPPHVVASLTVASAAHKTFVIAIICVARHPKISSCVSMKNLGPDSNDEIVGGAKNYRTERE